MPSERKSRWVNKNQIQMPIKIQVKITNTYKYKKITCKYPTQRESQDEGRYKSRQIHPIFLLLVLSKDTFLKMFSQSAALRMAN